MLNNNENLSELYIDENDPILHAVKIIDKAGHGCTKIALVVNKHCKLIGVINDGDIRRAILQGISFNDYSSKIMTKEYKYIFEGESRDKAIELMKAFSISQVPVVNKNMNVVGIHFINDFIINDPIDNLLVIMAGGKGTRLRPITKDLPKPMIRVAGKPILEHIINHAVGYGVKNICLAINYMGHIIEDYFREGQKFGCNISYIRENTPLGSAGALSLLTNIQNDIILMNGDLISQFNIKKMLEYHKRNKNYITIAAKDHIEKISYGVLDVEGKLVHNIKEKPEKHYLVNAGIYILNKDVLDIIPRNTEYFATDIIYKSLESNRQVGYFLINDEWIDVGEFKQLKKANGID